MITEFQGPYRWLSNMYPCEIPMKAPYHGIIFPCVESAYQVMKAEPSKNTGYVNLLKQFSKIDGYKAKKLGKTLTLRNDWNEVKVPIMKRLLEIKFQIPEFKAKLLSTRDIYIQEGNNWNDKFWGICLKTNTGENILGKLLMEIRSSL
jgi:hypothetical protein